MLKLSDEVLASANGKGYDEVVVRDITRQAKCLVDAGAEVGTVIGGGNYWGGRVETKVVHVKADQIRMLATVTNCIYVSEIFHGKGMETEILSPFPCGAITELSSIDRVSAFFTAGRAFLLAGDTGHPYFSTDTGIALWATELGIDEILSAKSIDGVYTADPKLNPDAERYDTLTIQEMIGKRLGVIGLMASVLCMKNKISLAIFDLYGDNAIADALRGVIHGTTVIV